MDAVFKPCTDCRSLDTCLEEDSCAHSLDAIAKANEANRKVTGCGDSNCAAEFAGGEIICNHNCVTEAVTIRRAPPVTQKATPPEIEELQKIANAKNAQRLAEGFKENNPKDAFGVLKACMSWVPQTVIMELALAMAEGGFKYGGHNYLVAAPRSSVYTDAAHRHLYQYEYEGDLDAESKVGLHHVSKAIASLTVLRAAQINGHWIDDRPPQAAPAGWFAELNKKMVALAEAFPEPVARYLRNGKRGPGRILEDA